VRHSKKHRLGELVEILSGFAFDSEKFGDSGDMPIVRIRDVIRGHSSTFYNGEFDKKYVLRDGDMLIGMDGEFNLAKWQGGPAVLNQRVCRISASSGILDDGYLFRFLPSALKAIENVTPFVTVKHLSVKTIRDIEIPLPPLAEQRRIAEVLDKAEALRAKRRAALAQLDSLTQSLFLDLFGDPVSNPKGLPKEPMSNLLSVKHGFAFKSEYFTDAGEFILLTPGNFYEGGGYRDRGDKQKYYIGPMPSGYTLRKDDLLVAMTEQAPGLLGSPILIPESDRFLHNQRLGLVEVKPGVDRLFLFHLFNTPGIRNLIQASSTGTKVKHTSPTKISAITIPVPPISLQREFARRITAVEKLKTAQRAALAELDALFASLQHRAFRGEL